MNDGHAFKKHILKSDGMHMLHQHACFDALCFACFCPLLAPTLLAAPAQTARGASVLVLKRMGASDQVDRLEPARCTSGCVLLFRVAEQIDRHAFALRRGKCVWCVRSGRGRW